MPIIMGGLSMPGQRALQTWSKAVKDSSKHRPAAGYADKTDRRFNAIIYFATAVINGR